MTSEACVFEVFRVSERCSEIPVRCSEQSYSVKSCTEACRWVGSRNQSRRCQETMGRRESSRLQAHISPESIYCPPRRRISGPGQEYHVFFITGNPGLISYYHTFLAYLSDLLNEDPEIANGVHIYGQSLGGFHSKTNEETSNAPYGLQQQIDHVECALENSVRVQMGSYKDQQAIDTSTNRPPKVILIGHSVGAYISLELLRRHRKQLSLGKEADMEIVGGVLLFPTITHIAQSPSGRKLGVWLTPSAYSPLKLITFQWLLKFPYLPLLVGILAHLLTSLVPRSVLGSLVKLATGFPADAAETTTAFIKSPMGVRQAL